MITSKLIISTIFLLMVGVFLSGCIGGNEAPVGQGLTQGPNRVVVYQNYLLLDPATGGNGTILVYNGTGSAVVNNTGYYPDYPRNVQVNRSCLGTVGGCTSGNIIVTVYGVDIFENPNRFETLTLPANDTATGNISWYNVTKITWSAAAANESIGAGWGVKFGIPNLIKNVGATVANGSDILGVTVAGSGKAVSAETFDLTNQTIQFDTAPNAVRDYILYYRGYGTMP